MVFPVSAERRAASRISVTMRFVSSDDIASGRAPSALAALGELRAEKYCAKVRQRIVIRRGNPRCCAHGGLRFVRQADANVVRGDRHDRPCPSVNFGIFPAVGPIPRGLQNRLRLRVSQHNRCFIVHARINVRLDTLRNRCHGQRPLAVHPPRH